MVNERAKGRNWRDYYGCDEVSPFLDISIASSCFGILFYSCSVNRCVIYKLEGASRLR